MTRRTTKSATRSLIAVAALGLVLASCGSDEGDPGDAGGGDSSAGEEGAGGGTTVEADEELAAMVPEDIAEAGVLRVGTDASYAPNEFFDEDGSTIVGFDVDLFDAVAAKLGLETQWENSSFDTIIVGVSSDKYDVGVSSFTINEDRKTQVNMISYYNAGTQWAVATGNPDGVDPDDACGLIVAVQTGTVQEEDDLPVRQEACGDNPFTVQSYEGQDEATSALVTGKAQAMLADSPIIGYAVSQTNGQIEAVGEVYDAAPYGYVAPLEDTDLADALAAALTSLEEDGTYGEILAEWGVEDGAIDDFAVNP
ncbi:ABC transporter substrate-binding protein [Ornithinicoccus hortensis]|uniref:Amino acid ABC transporter substrate-binding protein (PAAT family) n=1 Tax=Ornithinicoccus hortensis TaxID=82346 RepID=A0A542YVB6_9MICO|nr:ABC transporter substrate-binding protein [Ornithinicoccus hortensis]TQL52013.1 amino acid ABC transporter substrate-binding protein (PAAT family) [Ornithinicoccus hortensis]